MAENKGIMLAKSVQKHAGRAKEKILQNLGKVDRTADEIFDDHLNNFNRQQQNANRLQKEFNNYIRCIRAAQTASKSLMDAICEIYEPQWSGYEGLQAQAQSSESLWLDFSHKLGDQVLIPLNTYTGQFPEMKKKVEKRNRKLIDYDGQRHSFQNLQANANKRKDDVKLTKGREQLEEARRTYELLNTELHDELPALYDSRVLFLVTNLQTLFATEQVFHNETAKIYSELEAIVDKLATESQRGSNTLRNQALNAIKASSPVQSPVKQMNNANIANSNQYQNTNGSANPPSPSSASNTQEPRLDNVSPTPETAAEASASVAASSSLTASPSAAMTSSTRSNQSMSASNLVSDATAVDSSTNSPNAIARKTKMSKEENSSIAETTETTKDQDNNKDVMNNSTSTITASSNGTGTTTTTTNTNTTIATEVVIKKEMAAPQSNGKDIEATTNGNASTSVEKNLETETTINTAANTIATNGNNAANPTTITNNSSSPSSKTTSNTNPDDSNRKQLGNKLHLANDNLNRSRSSNRNSNQVVQTSKNPFEEDDDHIKDVKDVDDELCEIPKDATTTDLPPGVLYRVKATYGYVKEDVDELSFEVGDIIRVIEYDDPEDQEEGWLMGEKEGSDEKGLFPANFTRPI